MLKDAGLPYVKDAAQAKLMASETATFAAHQAIQVVHIYMIYIHIFFFCVSIIFELVLSIRLIFYIYNHHILVVLYLN